MKPAIFSLAALMILGLVSDASAQSRTIKVRDLTVRSKKSNGSAWDIFGGAPDLKVTIKVNRTLGPSDTTRTKQDTYSATFNESTVKVKHGDSITVTVWDEDVTDDDLIGKGSYVVKKGDFGKVISFTPFGQVTELKISFE